jgi:DNA-binding response OmpR family regulator
MVLSTEVGSDETTILVASSSDFVHNRLTPVLNALGYRPLTARNGDEALAHLLEGPVRILISDLSLPCAGDSWLPEVVKRYPDTAHIPIICLGEADRLQELRRAWSLGAHALLPRNVTPRTIVEIIMHLLRRCVSPNRIAGSGCGASPVPSAASGLHAPRSIGSSGSAGRFRTPR